MKTLTKLTLSVFCFVYSESVSAQSSMSSASAALSASAVSVSMGPIDQCKLGLKIINVILPKNKIEPLRVTLRQYLLDKFDPQYNSRCSCKAQRRDGLANHRITVRTVGKNNRLVLERGLSLEFIGDFEIKIPTSVDDSGYTLYYYCSQ